MAELFNRLLLATEHSDFDTGSEAVAMALAQRCKLPLASVFPLISNPEYEAVAPQLAARAEADAADKIQQLVAQAGSLGVQIEMRVRRGGDLYLEIVHEAQERNSDLIVIRRRGKRSFLANLLVGEMVSKVVAHAPCHVLVVPRGARMWNHRVLAAAEAGPQGRQVVATAMAVCQQCELPLHVVCVAAAESSRDEAETFVTDMVQMAQQNGVDAQAEVRAGKPFTEILAAAGTSQADLIVIGSRGEGHMGRAWIGGVTQKVVGLSEHPVLTLHP